MKLTAKVKLVTTKEQTELLTRTLCMANEACNHISGIAWDNQTFAQFRLHGLAYYDTGTAFPALGSQVVVRCEAKVADAYKLDKKVRREFHPLGAIAYDARILTWKMTQSIVSIWTLDGRIKVPFVCGDHQRKLLEGQRGEADLMLIDGTFYLSATCEVEQAELVDVADYLGVDMGIIQIATDSDGESHSGAAVEKKRRIMGNRRARLQRKGTKPAKRKLRQISQKQSRFQRNENHRISKTIVQKAKDTERGIAIEELGGIRERVTVGRQQRARLANWAFFDLRAKIEYKAKREGLPVVKVDPRNTSRTCHECGCIDKANRLTQSSFKCVTARAARRGHVANADHNAALNIRSRAKAKVNRPNINQ